MTYVTGRSRFRRFRPFINLLVAIFSFFPKSFSAFLLVKFRNITGKFGLLLRYVLLKVICPKCGDNVSIHPNVFLFHVGNLDIGENVSIHPMCYIDAAGGVTIGNNVSIAHGSSLISSNHTWQDEHIPIKYNKEVLGRIHIKDDVWIGCGCRILSGVTLCERTVVAAGAVVNKSFDNNCLLGGVPARIIKPI